MKNTFTLSVVIVVCTILICVTILLKSSSSKTTPIQWRYQVVNSNFNDGKWLEAFGDKGWEAVTTTTDRDYNVQILFKKPK